MKKLLMEFFTREAYDFLMRKQKLLMEITNIYKKFGKNYF
jgi:hypothetical protein